MREIITDIMEITICIVAIIIIIFANVTPIDTSTEYYRSARVIEKRCNTVYLEDTTGNIWCIDDNNDLILDERYILRMNDNNTSDVTDDIILEIE